MDLKAYHFSKRLTLKSINVTDMFKVVNHSPFEMALEVGFQKYIFIYNFGSIVCFNLATEELDKYLTILCSRLDMNRNQYRYDDFQVEIQDELDQFYKIDFSKIILKQFRFDSLRILALLVGESVALDFHVSVTTDLLNQTKIITEELRTLGKTKKSHKELVKYIGTSLATKQTITDDLYIFDEPDETWEDPNLGKFFEDLRRYLELQSRFKSIQYDLDLIQESAEVIADLITIRKQTALEVTIIALIAFEVLWSLLDKVKF